MHLFRTLLWSATCIVGYSASAPSTVLLCVDRLPVIQLVNSYWILFLNNLKRTISSADFVCDLGVLFDKELKFSRHCSVVARKASSVANMILRVFTSRDSRLLMRAFKTYVRPILDYACEVVNPYLACDVETLERVQRDYTRRVALRAGIEYVDYDDRLRSMEVPLLSDGRNNACILIREMQSRVQTEFLLLQIQVYLECSSRGHCYCPIPTCCKT